MFCSRIQELDGGFFERFGSLLKEHQTDDEVAVEPPDSEEEAVEEEIKKDSTANLLAVAAVGLNVSQ